MRAALKFGPPYRVGIGRSGAYVVVPDLIDLATICRRANVPHISRLISGYRVGILHTH